MKWYGKKYFQKICGPLDVKKQAFFQIFFYNRYTVVKTQSRVELWSSIASWIFFFFVFERPLKDFLFYSPIFLNLWFRYLQTRIKESCSYLSSQLFFKTPHKTFIFSEKSKRKKKCRPKFQKLSNSIPAKMRYTFEIRRFLL